MTANNLFAIACAYMALCAVIIGFTAIAHNAHRKNRHYED
jgi:hypothetical protein